MLHKLAEWLYKLLYYFAQNPDMEYLLVDSTILRAHACAIPKENDKKTTVVHAVSDALGHPLDFIVTAG